MADTTNPITLREFREAEGVEDWRVLAEGACAFFRTESFAASAELVRAIAEATDDAGHSPDVDLRPGGVTVRLITASLPPYVDRPVRALVMGFGPGETAAGFRSDAETAPPRFERAVGGRRRCRNGGMVNEAKAMIKER